MKNSTWQGGLLNAPIGTTLERTIFWSAVLLHAIIFFTIATDNNGDPNEYIVIARTLFSPDSPINPNRFVGYPFFLKITSLNLYLLNLTFFVQHVLFLFSLWFFAKKVTDTALLKALIYLPALIPSIAYIPNLLFPDCLILSLLLIFSGYLYAGQFFRAFLVGMGLISIKLVFIFLPIIVLGAYILNRWQELNRKYIFLALSIALIGLIPSVFLFSPFPLYQSVVQKPAFIDEPAIPTVVPMPFKFICGGEIRDLSDAAVIAKFTDHSSDLYHMPLGQSLVDQFQCTPAEVKTIQRNLVISFFAQAPAHQIYKFIRRFVRNTFVLMDVPHVGYMLELKYQLMNSNFSPTQYYEKTQLEYFEGQGMKPLRPPGQSFLRILNAYNFKYERALSIIIMGIIGLGFLGILVKKVPYLPSVTSILVLIAFYNFNITFFAFGYDRYIFINYFLWIALIVVYLKYWVVKKVSLSILK
jgi:hypothetical protein